MRNLHLTFDWQYIGQNKVKILQKFVAFSENMNFNTIFAKNKAKFMLVSL